MFCCPEIPGLTESILLSAAQPRDKRTKLIIMINGIKGLNGMDGIIVLGDISNSPFVV